MQTLKALAKKTEDLKKEVTKEATKAGKKEIKAHLDEIFAAHPEIKGIRWKQYTPYFNDGDPCEFSVREALVSFGEETGGDYDDGYVGTYELKNKKHPALKAIQEFSELIQSEGMSDVMQTVFDDHVQVTVTPADVEVESYEHD
jgi:hypothetical protein